MRNNATIIGLVTLAALSWQRPCFAQEVSTGWDVSIAAGYGRMNSPLKAAHDVQTFVLPNVRYYGEHFYAENFTLGYSLVETPDLLIDVESRLNDDGLFFELNGLQQLLATDLFSYKPNGIPIRGNVTYPDIQRSISYLAGLNISFPSEYGQISVGHFRDVTSVHHGSESVVKYRHEGLMGPVKWGFELGMTYKDQALVDYYYVLSQAELSAYKLPQYSGGSHNYNAKLVLNMPITGHWFFVNSAEYTRLGEGIRHSLLVDKNHYTVFFAGVAYAF